MKKFLLLLFLLIYLLAPYLAISLNSSLKIWVLDVGQGDAILIQTPKRKHILIDTGEKDLLFSELGEVLPYWVRTIDYFIISHPHMDHIASAKALYERYSVLNTIWYPIEYSNPVYNWLKYSLQSYAGNLQVGLLKKELTIDNVKIVFLFPINENLNEENINNSSLVFILKYSGFSGIFMGDLEKEKEPQLVKNYKDLFGLKNITYLKAGHHCSDTSSTEKLLQNLKPVFATCSVGEGNSFGHPSPETLNNFDNLGVKYFRTDTEGRITITVSGSGYIIETEKQQHKN